LQVPRSKITQFLAANNFCLDISIFDKVKGKGKGKNIV
jgi:hypothetical protein